MDPIAMRTQTGGRHFSLSLIVGFFIAGLGAADVAPVRDLTDSYYLRGDSVLFTKAKDCQLYLSTANLLDRSERLLFARAVLEGSAALEGSASGDVKNLARHDVQTLQQYLSSERHLYTTAKKFVPKGWEWFYAVQVLLGSQDCGTLHDALDDIEAIPKENLNAIAVVLDPVNVFRIYNAKRIDPTHELFRRATLLYGRLLILQGENDLGVPVFADAIGRGWPDAGPYYLETLEMAYGESTARVLDKYLRAIQMPDESLAPFFRYVTNEKGIRHTTPAMEAVYPFCYEWTGDPLFRRIAEVACLAGDGDSDRAIDLLLEIDPSLRPDERGEFASWKSDGSPELRNTPLYMAILLCRRGAMPSEIETYFKLYLDRNVDRPDLVREEIRKNLYAFENVRGGGKTVAMLADFMIDSGFATDEPHPNIEVFGRMTWKTHLYDMKLSGHFLEGNHDEAKKIAAMLAESYSPDCLAGNNAANILGVILLEDAATREEGERVLHRLATESAFEHLRGMALAHLMNQRMTDRQPADDLLPLVERMRADVVTESMRARLDGIEESIQLSTTEEYLRNGRPTSSNQR